MKRYQVKSLFVLFVTLLVGIITTGKAQVNIISPSGIETEVLINGMASPPLNSFQFNMGDIATINWTDNVNTGQFGGYSGVQILVTPADGLGIGPEMVGFPFNTWEINSDGAGGFIAENTQMLALSFPGGMVFDLDIHIPAFLQTTGGTIVFDVIAGDVFGTIAQPGPDDGLPYFELNVAPEPCTLALLALGGLTLLRRGRFSTSPDRQGVLRK